MEGIQDLAILHSSISDPEGRGEIETRFHHYLDTKFRNRLGYLNHQYRQAYPEVKIRLKSKIAELNRRIIETKRIWARYAPPENWDC